METPDYTGLIRKTVNAAVAGKLSTPEHDAVMFDAIKSSVDQAYQDGVRIGYNPKRNTIYASIVIVFLIALIGVGVWATPKLQYTPAAGTQFHTAPNWELGILAETKQQAALDFVVVDVNTKLGADWGFSAELQYKDFLFVRAANLTDPMKVRVLVYHYADGKWGFYGEEQN